MTTHKLAIHLDEWDRDVYSGRQIDLDAYRYACKAFGVSEIAVINSGKIEYEMNDESMKLEEFDSFEDFRLAHQDESITIVEVPWAAPADAVGLHKENVPRTDWYVIGPARGWKCQPQGCKWISIKQNGKGALHGQHIATLLLGHLFITKKGR